MTLTRNDAGVDAATDGRVDDSPDDGPSTAFSPDPAADELPPPDVTYWQDVRRRFFRNRLAVLGLSLLIFFILVAVFADVITTKGYNELAKDYARDLNQRPFGRFFLGSDDQGRDLYTRLVYAVRTSLLLALVVTAIVTTIGLCLGATAGFFGGKIDLLLSRVIEIFLAIPFIIIGISMIAVFGSHFWVVMVALIATGWMSTARVFRAAVIQVKTNDYIEAARAAGASTGRIIRRHVLPNAIQPVIVLIAFTFSGVILSESIFSFLGIGFIEPRPTLGVMMRSARTVLSLHPHLFFLPCITLVLLTLSIVLIGDGVRDALDPKLRGSK